MRNLQLTLRGYLVGHIWMPGIECFKPLDFDCTAYLRRCGNVQDKLRECVLDATNDGDFRSCVIAQGELVASYVKPRADGRGPVRVTRYWPLDTFPSIADCLHADPDWFPTFPDDEADEFADDDAMAEA